MVTAMDYYDNLRKDGGSFIPIYNSSNHVGRNMHRLNLTEGDNDFIILCNIPIFLRYTSEDKTQDVSNVAYAGSAGAMLAMYHWNNGNGVIVKDIEGMNNKCPLRFTTEITDTYASPITPVRTFTDMITRDPGDVVNPQPFAVIGALYSTVSVKVATVTGVYDMLQVSPGATSEKLSDRKLYPIFARTIPSDAGSAKLLPQRLHEMGAKYVNVVYVSNDYGNAYVNSIRKYAASVGMNITEVPIDGSAPLTKDTVKENLKLLDSRINYAIGVFFREHYDVIMEAAAELGVAGPGKFWLFCGALSEYLVYDTQTFQKGSALHTATFGNGILSELGGARNLPEYDAFKKQWELLGDDPDESLNYINSKQPISPQGFNFNRTNEYFHEEPNSQSFYGYDAVIGMGIAGCEAITKHNSTFLNENVFSGEQYYDSFVNINFASGSGDVMIDKETASRTFLSSHYLLSNIIEVGNNGDDVTLQGVGYAYMFHDGNNWENITYGREFKYSSGTTNQPEFLVPAEENMNYISKGVRGFSLTLSIIAMVVSIIFLVYTFIKRDLRQIRYSQPSFLYMICIGTFLMALSILPLSLDDSIAADWVLNTSCQLVYWFFSFGFVTTFAALFSKLWRMHKVMKASIAMRRVTVTRGDVLIPFFVLLGCNLIILTVWTSVNPVSWIRSSSPHQRNEFNQVIESEGFCGGDNLIAYHWSLITVNGIALILACYQAYIGLGFDTDMNENRYICIAMVSIFQILFFGIPVLYIIHDDPSATLYVISSVCFIICVATLLFIFIPKIIFIRNNTSIRNEGKQWGTMAASKSTLPPRLRELRAQQRAKPNIKSKKSLVSIKEGDELIEEASKSEYESNENNAEFISLKESDNV